LTSIIKRASCDGCGEVHGLANDDQLFAALTAFNPSLAIRAMRASRRRKCRDDLSDPHPARRRALASAHAAWAASNSPKSSLLAFGKRPDADGN